MDAFVYSDLSPELRRRVEEVVRMVYGGWDNYVDYLMCVADCVNNKHGDTVTCEAICDRKLGVKRE